MRIQHNIAALNSYRQLNTNNSNVAKNLEKLSSGYRINRAGDDAAGLAISEKMRAQIKGLETAQKNAQDGISLIQTAEGNLQEVHSMLNRMVELATQAANGTYMDSNRAELQKEIVSLNEEIDRIAQSANFNGLKLLDGSLGRANGITLDDPVMGTPTTSDDIGTLGDTEVDGVKVANKPETKYSASFYVGEITNNNAAAKNLVFNYKDANGGAKSVTLAVAAGKTVTTEDIAKALSGTTVAGVTRTDNNEAAGVTATGGTGKFSELYDVKYDGNIITVSAKYGAGEKVANAAADANAAALSTVGGNFQLASIVNTDFDAADKAAAIDKLKEDYNGDATVTSIGYGTAAGTATSYAAAQEGNYKVASTTLQLAGNAAALHNSAIKVGDKTYVIQKGDEELKGTDNNMIVVKVGDSDTAATVATKLAAKISETNADGTSKNGGFVATAAGDTLTIMENTSRGADIYADANKQATKAADIASLVSLTKADAVNTSALTIDADTLVNGTTIDAGGQKFYLTSSDKDVAPAGATLVKYAADATSDEIATALTTAMTDAGLTATRAGAKITYSGAGVVSAGGKGLVMQVGDTNESYQKIGVTVKSMDAASLGLAGIDISTQEGAAAAIDAVNSAIDQVSSARGDLGALQNRLDHTINNLGVATENITAAESRIRDTDMAKEMMDFTKNNILVQAAQAMLAQANMVPQSVLQLLQ